MRTSRWMRRGLTAAAVVVLTCDAHVAYSQSLGDVARREAERRKDVAAPGRVYTNEDLGNVEQPQAAQPTTPQSQSSESTPAQEPASSVETSQGTVPGTVIEEDPVTGQTNIKTTVPARVKRDEQYWRGRAKDVRDRLAKTNADLAAAQARLAALDAGPQTPATAREREVVAATVHRLESEARYRNDDVAKLRTFAESLKVPPDWLQ